jgi:hypothetical protein
MSILFGIGVADDRNENATIPPPTIKPTMTKAAVPISNGLTQSAPPEDFDFPRLPDFRPPAAGRDEKRLGADSAASSSSSSSETGNAPSLSLVFRKSNSSSSGGGSFTRNGFLHFGHGILFPTAERFFNFKLALHAGHLIVITSLMASFLSNRNTQPRRDYQNLMRKALNGVPSK